MDLKMCVSMNFMVAPCLSDIRHFIVQLMHTNYKILKKKLRGLSPRANYNDRAAAAGRRS